MAVTVTLPADTKTPGTAGHTSDHNLIADAITAVAAAVPVMAAADHSTHTSVSAATPGIGISAAWTIPANDPKAGTVYRLTATGFGTWGSTQQALTVISRIDAAAVTAIANGTIAATAFAISTPVFWRAVTELSVISAGVSGTFDIYQEVTVSARGVAILPGTAASNTVTTIDANSAAGGTTALDTTVSHTFDFGAFWASATGAPTITGVRSWLERLGP